MDRDSRKEDMLKISKEGFNPMLMSAEELKRMDENIKGLQIQFQQEYCPSCERYDKEKNDFKEKGHTNNPQDCKYHWTDVVGDCWNYTGYNKTESIENKKLTINDVYGKRVRLKGAFFNPEGELLKAIRDGKVEGFSASDDLPSSTFIPEGSEGTITEGRYSSGVYNYDVEWPVQFDKFKKGVPGYSKEFAIGIKHEFLEFIGENNDFKRKEV